MIDIDFLQWKDLSTSDGTNAKVSGATDRSRKPISSLLLGMDSTSESLLCFSEKSVDISAELALRKGGKAAFVERYVKTQANLVHTPSSQMPLDFLSESPLQEYVIDLKKKAFAFGTCTAGNTTGTKTATKEPEAKENETKR